MKTRKGGGGQEKCDPRSKEQGRDTVKEEPRGDVLGQKSNDSETEK